VRTPLAVIRGYVELLQSDISDEQRDRAFARLQSEILRMESLIADLLLLSELTSSQSLNKSQVNLSDLLFSTIHDLQTLHPNRKVESHIESNVQLSGDERLLNQLISNIFGNIIRHTSTNDPVGIALNVHESKIHIVVEDGGSGLSDDAYAQGPTYFQRFEKSRSRATGGSGLGMSMILAIVQSHDGTVGFSKSELGGLRVTIQLPFK
jgi:signal transduction histidine kinase